MTYDEAFALLRKYNSEPFHITHALTVSNVMRRMANELGYGDEADFWAIVRVCCTTSTLSSGRTSTARSASSCFKRAARTSG